MYVYQIDSKVRINRPQDTYWNGKTGTITGYSKYRDLYVLRVDGEVDPAWFLGSQLVADDMTNVTYTDPPSSDEIIADLTEQLYELCIIADDARDRLAKAQETYRHDMRHWENTLREQKEEQTWCDDGVNSVIATLNEGFIGNWEIEPYRKRKRVRVRIAGTAYTYEDVWVDEDSDEDDPDNWYEEEDSDCPLGTDWAYDQLSNTVTYNGFDDIEFN